MKLIKGVNLYTPEYLGVKDVFLAGGKICKIADNIELPTELEVEVIDGTGLLLLPGFIDSHVHVLGGGGEGGFANRTPEATLSGLTRYGITTVVGCLGTDGIGRDIKSLVAKIKGLRELGISAYAYTGSYQVPVRTLTGGIIDDIMMIEEIIGTGEIAISDHRSSQPTADEFKRLCADTRVGGILSGKAGIINIHLGDSPRCMDLINQVIAETEIPATQFLPTHVNRNAALFEEAVGQGSLPMFSADGVFQGMGMGQSSCLLKEVRECVEKEGIPLEIAIKAITSNPAKVLCLPQKGRIEEGMDADLCLMTKDLEIDTVIAMGQVMVKKGEPIVKGAFEGQ